MTFTSVFEAPEYDILTNVTKLDQKALGVEVLNVRRGQQPVDCWCERDQESGNTCSCFPGWCSMKINANLLNMK